MVMLLPLPDFVAALAEAPLLLIKLDDTSRELEIGLASLKEEQVRPQLEPNVLAFHTAAGDARELSRAGTVPETQPVTASELRRRLAQARYFAITIEKRRLDASYAHRIAIGRARNKDIVLRHPSVSKFHAWFEADPKLGFCIADAGSRNGTRKNQLELRARELTPAKTGDVLLFGSVEAVVCDAETLWRAVST